MTAERLATRLDFVLKFLITLGFIQPVISKIAQHAFWAGRFVEWGYPAWGAVATSIVESIGLIGLWIPRTTPYAGVLLSVVMLGAIYTWFVNGPLTAAVIPGILLVLLVGLVWRTWKR